MFSLDVTPPRSEDFHAFQVLFSELAKEFLCRLVSEFDKEVDQILRERKLKKLTYDNTERLPDFKTSSARSDKSWKIDPLPKRLRQRHLDLGWR